MLFSHMCLLLFFEFWNRLFYRGALRTISSGLWASRICSPRGVIAGPVAVSAILGWKKFGICHDMFNEYDIQIPVLFERMRTC